MQDFSKQVEDDSEGSLEKLVGDASSRLVLIKDILKRFADANLSSEAARDRIAEEIAENLNGYRECLRGHTL